MEDTPSKTDLVNAVAEKTGITKKAAPVAVDVFIACMEAALKEGEKLTIPGFGTFSVRERRARTSRNPAIGKKMKIPTKKVPKFTSGEGSEEVGYLLQAGRLSRERSASEEFWGILAFVRSHPLSLLQQKKTLKEY